MTTKALNPFPDYAVTRLGPGQEADGATVVTPAIASERQLVKDYVARLITPVTAGQTNAALCAVRGDYGTGKTHLLNDVASQLKAASTAPTSILRATCIETDPLSWFRTKVGPQLDLLPISDVALHLYSAAGETVAKATELTASAADVLKENPTRIRDLIRDNHLSVDEVGREFEKLLGMICKEYHPIIRRVLSRLVWSGTEGAARSWLRGAALLPREAELLGVPAAIDSADQASGVIGAIAALHRAVQRPFVMLVDELEHFTRYDLAHNSSGNVTWLKRLLEQLGTAGALALVAGHWSAWETTKDYLDRFPQYAPIDLLKLEPKDVLLVLKARLSTLPEGLGLAQAQVIATIADGNMRRVMSLCNLLFRETNGFATEPTERQIHEAWTSLAQRIPQQQALDEILSMLEPRRFRVTRETTFHSIPFDLVAERDDGRAIVVEAKHASTETEHYDAARQFIDKLGSVGRFAPRAIGMFLANGSIDDELLGILRGSGASNLRWFDLTARDVLERIAAEIGAIDGEPGGVVRAARPPSPSRADSPPKVAPATNSAAIEAEATKLKGLNTELEQRLKELDQRRYQETRALQERLDKLARSPRDNALRDGTEVSPERARASYEAMLEVPALSRRLRYLGAYLIFGSVSIVLGILLLAMRGDLLADVPKFEYTQLSMILTFSCTGLLAGGVAVIWRRYSQVVEYFDFARQTIQNLYVRDVPLGHLGSVNMVFRVAIDHYGPSRGRYEAIRQLQSSETLPPLVASYFDDLLKLTRVDQSQVSSTSGTSRSS